MPADLSAHIAAETEAAKPRPKLTERLGRIADLLEASGIDLDEVGRIDKIRVGDYTTAVKVRNADGTDSVEQITNRADSLVITPSWETGPEWPVVQPAPPVKITPTRSKRTVLKGWHTAVILPDPQIGYRRDIETMELDPFHDEAAMSIALQVLADARPDLVINLGDFLDLAEFGTFDQEAGFALTTQAGINRGGQFVAEQRAAAPEAEVTIIEGNHDRRLQKSILRNAKAAFGLKRANEPESWPVLSVPNLLRLDDLGVEYVEGYPAGEKWINDNLVCIHGHKVNSTGSTASRVIGDERVSVIFGHVHRIETTYKTRRVRDGGKSSFAHTPGCLARIDGAVPSTKGSTDCMGRAVPTVEDWQQGVTVVRFQEGNGRFSLQSVPIFDGWAAWGDREYVAEAPA